MNSVLLILALCITYAHCYGTGAPVKACDMLAPAHTNQSAPTRPNLFPQQTTSPYGIQVDTSQWLSNQTLTVSFTGTPISGFILQARKTNGAVRGLGMFDETSLPNDTQTGPCVLGSNKISVTHTNPNVKGQLKFKWILPQTEIYNGSFYFQGAVAQNHDIFWTNIMTDIFTKDSNTTQPHPTTEAPMTTTTTDAPKTTTPSSAHVPIVSTFLLLTIIGLFL